VVREPPYDLDALAELYETNATHKACVDAKVTNIVGLGHRFVAKGEEGDPEELERLERLFARCNPEQTFSETMRQVWTDVETLGNGYLEVTRTEPGEVDGFYHMPGTTVRVRADKSGFVQIREGKKRHFRQLGDREARRDPETGELQTEVLQFRKYTPQSSFYGVPDVVAALAAAVGDRAAREYNIDYFEHNAIPRMAVIVEGAHVSEEVMAAIRQFMETEIRGKPHKTLVLDVPGEVGVRLEPLGQLAGDDAAFLEYRKANRDEIMMVHRVPPSKITVVENANLANTKDQDKTFREQVVRPEQRRIEHQLNQMIRDEVGVESWEFEFVEMDLGEKRDEAELARIYASIGAWTANEVRARQGLEPRPGGDELVARGVWRSVVGQERGAGNEMARETGPMPAELAKAATGDAGEAA
jgi:PBSX family phage portal protein